MSCYTLLVCVHSWLGQYDCEFSEEGGSSASSSSAARCIVQVGERGFLHLVSVVPPQGKAPHPVPRHASTPEKSNKDSSCTSDRQFTFQGQRNPWCPCKRHQLLLCPVLLNKRRSRSQCPAPCDECAGSPFKKKTKYLQVLVIKNLHSKGHLQLSN